MPLPTDPLDLQAFAARLTQEILAAVRQQVALATLQVLEESGVRIERHARRRRERGATPAEASPVAVEAIAAAPLAEPAPAKAPAAHHAPPGRDPFIEKVRTDLQDAYADNDGRPVAPERIAFRLKADRDLVDAALTYLVSRREARAMRSRGKVAYVPFRSLESRPSAHPAHPATGEAAASGRPSGPSGNPGPAAAGPVAPTGDGPSSDSSASS